MAQYITLAESKQYLGDIYESAYLDEGTGLPDDTILQEDIDTISGVINAYVMKAYNFTIVGVESLAVLKGISQQLLKSKAYERFDSMEVPEAVIANADKAIFRLKDISMGKMLLSDSVQSPKGTGFSFSLRGRSGVFTRDRMTGV